MSNLYKVGDKLKIVTNNHGHNFDTDEIVEVITDRGFDYLAKSIDYPIKTTWYIQDDEVVPVMLKDTFKIGDKAKVVSNSYTSHCFAIGDIVTIKNIEEHSYKVVNGKTIQWLYQCEMEPIKSEPKQAVMTKPAGNDMVNHPNHYTSGGIEVYDYIKCKLSTEGLRGYLQGNILKYVSRAGKKDANVVQDLRKALWYLNKWIDSYGNESVLDDITQQEFEQEFEIRPISKKQIGFIAGLTKAVGLDRYNLPDDLSPLPNYKELTEGEATELIDRLLIMKGDK